MQITITSQKISVTIQVHGVGIADYAATETYLQTALPNPAIKNREAICQAFINLLKTCPTANASDLWHHIVYRIYFDILGKLGVTSPGQSWVRTSGEALELFLERYYEPFLSPHGIVIKALITGPEKKAALHLMGLGATVGAAKLDVALYLKQASTLAIFGGVHVKASLAERVSDDIPCSRAMMALGLFSPLWTIDVKSFPPPNGDCINRGEFGSPKTPSEKRIYVENHGEFDNAYSGNQRTHPSISPTPSGKRIYDIDLANQPDQFCKDVIAAAQRFNLKLQAAAAQSSVKAP